MRIAVLSDIHGNIQALDAVLFELERNKIDQLFVLGDQLGYYYDASSVYKKLDSFKKHMIMGNHERIFLKCAKESNNTYLNEVSKKYGNSFKHYLETFDNKLMDKIKKLPARIETEIENIKFLLVHGSPFDSDAYIYPDTEWDVLKGFLTDEFDFIFFGHTHYPMYFGGSGTKLINPGSVGQARNIGGVANWGIFNTANQVYEPQATPYNFGNTVKTLREFGEENQYLYQVLSRNNLTGK